MDSDRIGRQSARHHDGIRRLDDRTGNPIAMTRSDRMLRTLCAAVGTLRTIRSAGRFGRVGSRVRSVDLDGIPCDEIRLRSGIHDRIHGVYPCRGSVVAQ